VTAPDVELPPLQIEKLPSGLTLLAIQKRGCPLPRAAFVAGGSVRGPAGEGGAGAVHRGRCFRRGTRRRPAHDVDDLIESMGAQLYADVSMEEAALALTVPAELSERALDALLEVALEPAFEESEVAAARRRTIAGLQSDLDEPSTVAGRAWSRWAMRRGIPMPIHRRGSAGTGDVPARGRSQLPRHPLPAAGRLLAVVGRPPARAPRAAPAQACALGVLLAGTEPAKRAPVRRASAVGGDARGDHPQARRDAGAGADRLPGLPRSTPRYAEAVVSNTALGGGFTSLLVDAIRVDRGLSYSCPRGCT